MRLTFLPENWELATSVSKTATPSGEGRYIPIQDFSVDLLIESGVAAIYCETNSGRPTWHKGGWAKQLIRTGLSIGGQADAVVASKPFFLNEITLLNFQDISADFDLRISIPQWLEQITIQVWAYTGDVFGEYSQILNEIKTAVT